MPDLSFMQSDFMIPLLFGCNHLCFLLNGITGFFDHQSLWEESNDILLLSMELFHGVSHQWKVAPDTTTFDWLLLCQIGFHDSLTQEEINLFLYMSIAICISFFPTLSNFAGVHLIMSSWTYLTFTLRHIFEVAITFWKWSLNSSPKAAMEKICSQKCIIDQELDNGNRDDDNVLNDNNDNNIFSVPW